VRFAPAPGLPDAKQNIFNAERTLSVAAREAKFKPTVVDGKAVKVTGVISYDFMLK